MSRDRCLPWAIVDCGNGVFRTEFLRVGECTPEGTVDLQPTEHLAEQSRHLRESTARIRAEEEARRRSSTAPLLREGDLFS